MLQRQKQVQVGSERVGASMPLVSGGPGPGREIKASDGTTVRLAADNDGEKIVLTNREGAVIFEYSPDTGKCTLTVPRGDLNLRVPDGDVNFFSGRDMSFFCPGHMNLVGGSGVNISTAKPGPAGASIALDRDRLQVSGRKVAVKGEQADMAVVKSRMRGRLLSVRFDRSRLHVDHLEILAETISQKSRALYQRVERLMQINAGRMRTFVSGLFHLKGRRTYLKADKEMKLKADRIHLR